MMKRMRLGALSGALMLAVIPVACATGSGVAGAGEIGVEVRNDLIPSTAITVYVVPESGGRRLLGNVSPGATRTLSFRDFTVGEYRLMARTTGGAEIVSNPVVVGNAETIRWNLASNLLSVTQPGS